MWWRRRKSGDFADEIRAHVQLEIDRLLEQGFSEAEAIAAAHRSFGNITAAEERFYEASRWMWLDPLQRDLRYAARSLAKNRGFTLGAIWVLALGIGANTAIFSVVNGVLLRPLAYHDPDRIVAIEPFWKNYGRTSTNVSAPDFLDWQAGNTVFSVMACHLGGEAPVVVNRAAEYADVRWVTGSFFDVFGLPPAAGRLISPRARASGIAVVSHDWAESHFGSASNALGRSIVVRGESAEIIGVAVPGFRYPDRSDLWLRLAEPVKGSRSGHNYRAIGRLKRGVSLPAAQVEMRAIGARIERQYAETRFKSVALTPLQEHLTGNVRRTLGVLLGAVMLVLLIACANVANLLLARSAARARETAVRTALGASRWRVVRQLLTENLLLAGVAAVSAIGLAHLLLNRLLALAPAGLPRLDEVRIDARVLLFTVAISLFASLVSGLAPALRASRLDLIEALKQGGGKGAVFAGRGRLRSALTVAEVALSVVLLAGAGLLLRSFQALHAVELGFDTGGVLVAHTSFAARTEEEARRRSEFYPDLLTRVRALPGVMQAAAMRFPPFQGNTSNGSYSIQGRPDARPGEQPQAEFQVVTPAYFATLGIPIQLGRDFNEADALGRPRVVIINESFARAAFPDRNPIGQRIKCGFLLTTMDWMEIVGVAGDTRRLNPGKSASPELFMAALQHPPASGSLSLVVRTVMEPARLAPAIRQLIQERNPEIPVRFETMDQAFAESLSYQRFRAVLVGAFALLAALLSVVGIYSVLSYLAGQRTREFGVRLALGASTSGIIATVVGDGMRLVVIGLAVGFGGALAVTRVLETLLYSVKSTDPLTYAAVLVLLAIAALAASGIPAFRAAQMNPVVALREE
jgi:predicted permease